MKTNLFKTIFFLAIFLMLPNFTRAAEDLSRITGNGGTVYFAHDFESGILTPDAGSGTWGWVGGNPAGPASTYGTGNCAPNTSTYHFTVVDNGVPAQGANSGSSHSLKTPYLGACPNESTNRDMTTIGLPTPVTEYYIRWYQKWTGSFQATQQQKLTKFYKNGDTQQTTETTYYAMEGAGVGATTNRGRNSMFNIDGHFNKGGWTMYSGEVWVYPDQADSTYYNGVNRSWDDDPTTLSGFNFEIDRWYLIEIHSKLNTPVSDSNAVFEMWVDGNLLYGVYNYRNRNGTTYNSPGTDVFELQHVYYNRSSFDQSTYMDNIVIADRRIGSVGGGDIVAPSAPTGLGVI